MTLRKPSNGKSLKRRTDGDWHGELAEYRSGTGWLINWLRNTAPNYKNGMKVALQSKGAPVASMMDILGAIDGVDIVECSGKDVAGWAGRLWDAVASCLPDSETDAIPVHHISQPALDLAANIAATKPLGDGAWAWDRNKSMEDISPLVAVTMAFGSATAAEVSKTKMYELMKRSDCDFSLMLGGRRLINRARLEAWIDRQTDAGKTS